jgi:Cd2+/Zn2+-exporting ATPase
MDYMLEGLDCANCAAKIEKALNKHSQFAFARVNFVTKTLSVDSDEQDASLLREIVSSIEPGVKMTKKTNADSRSSTRLKSGDIWKIVWMALSGMLLAVALLVGKDFEWFLLGPAYLIVGYKVLAIALRDIMRGRFFNEMVLMALATIGAIALGEPHEAVGVMLFYSVGEFLQQRAVDSSRRSISGLLGLRPDYARIVVDSQSRIVKPEDVKPNDIVEVRPGEKIPLDGIVIKGESSVDTSSLTGESMPRSVGIGSNVLAGFINDSGVLIVKVASVFGESSAARILNLVENASSHKAPAEKFMTKLAAVYTPFVVVAAALVAILPPLFIPGAEFGTWAYRALVLLVISCPCALVISIPLGYFGGVGRASRHGILVKGANYLDALLAADTVVFDKTGTITKGTFSVERIEASAGFSSSEVLDYAARLERYSSHPIARAIVRARYKEQNFSNHNEGSKDHDTYKEFKGKGVSGLIDGRSVVVGTKDFLEGLGVIMPLAARVGSAAETVSHIAVDGHYAGSLYLADSIKPEARTLVSDLKALGVRRIAMLTGDGKEVAEVVAKAVGIDEYHANLLPEDKAKHLMAMKSELPDKKKLVFVGDGMNDAPVLMLADVGIAMGGLGSDAAIEAADIVIMDDAIDRIPKALEIAAFTRKIVMQNIFFALGAKGIFLVLGAMGLAGMWEAVIADVGVALVAVLNSIRAARR